ncbi:MAG: phosphoglycolate phosphatase [Halofilum sp. (in: g-proteobacteria)]|nr:phosphoglycolate phosphatase [Halofilum sp. (in: g-proteobacteria)]
MAQAKALLIDLDGTLVDSAPELAIAVNEVRQAHGLPPASLQQVRDWVGEGVTVLLQKALRGAADDQPPSDLPTVARVRFDAAYERMLGRRSKPYPGVHRGLRRLGEAGFQLACLTNKPEGFARDLLAALDLLEPFGVVVGGDSTGARKPDPEPARCAAERLGVRPAECLLIGDSAIDVATARNFGCPVWCLRSGYSRGQAPDELGADRVFDRFDEVVDVLVGGGPA